MTQTDPAAPVYCAPANAAEAGRVDIRTVRSNPDYWYPVAWSREVKPGKPIGTPYAGLPIALDPNGVGEGMG